VKTVSQNRLFTLLTLLVAVVMLAALLAGTHPIGMNDGGYW
jgi:type II secretory pathway pseudopilin PulG